MQVLRVIILIFFFFNYGYSQITEVTHLRETSAITPGNTVQTPIESIDSVTISGDNGYRILYQNNGNILLDRRVLVDSITYNIPDINLLPTLETLPISNITSYSAMSGGVSITNNGTSIIKKGICWSTIPNPTIANNKTANGIGTNNFISTLLPLQPETTYYIRAYATNESGTSYGNELVFTTQSPNLSLSLPNITTDEIIYEDGLNALVTGTTAVSNGTINSRGFCWAIGTTPTINSTTVISGEGSGVFEGALSNLLPNRVYRVRAFATSEAGVAYGNEILFKTNNYPTRLDIRDLTITDISASFELSFGDDGDSSIIEKGIWWSTQPNPNLEGNYDAISSDQSRFFKILTNLQPNTTYYVRTYVTNGIGTSYSFVDSITTMTTLDIDDIYSFIAKGLEFGSIHFGQKAYDIFSDMLCGDMALSGSVYGWYRASITEFQSTVSTVTEPSYGVTGNDRDKMLRYYTELLAKVNAIEVQLTPFGALPEINEERWLLGQALAIRAYSHFLLSQYYQETFNEDEVVLPLFIGSEYDFTPVSMALIYNSIENDLNTSIELLNGFERPTKDYIDLSVAKSILANAIIATRDQSRMQEVVNLCDDIIETSGPLMSATEILESGFNDISIPGWIWGRDTEEDSLGLRSWWGQVDFFSYSYAAVGDTKVMDEGLYNSMRADDIRRDQFFATPGANYLQPLFKQYDADRVPFGSDDQLNTSDYVYFRVAEIHLLRAEALARMGQDDEAREALLIFLSQRLADTSYLESLSGQALLDEIYLQTRIELWGEGKSYFAMKRNEATIQRGSNHLSFVDVSINHDDDRLTFNFSIQEPIGKPEIEVLKCYEMITSSTNSLIMNEETTDYSFQIPYIANSVGYEITAQTFESTNMPGLIATINETTISSIEGFLSFNVSGIPSNHGSAEFTINDLIPGLGSCEISLEVLPVADCISNQTVLSIDFGLQYPEEISWELYSIFDSSTPVFSGGGNGEYIGLSSVKESFCLQDGDYVLSIFNDNICGGTGSYNLYDTQGNNYVCTGNLNSQQLRQFTAGEDSISQNITLAIELGDTPRDQNIRWRIKDSNGSIVAKNYIGTGWFSNPNENPYLELSGTIEEQLCLSPGIYSFEIRDIHLNCPYTPHAIYGLNGDIILDNSGIANCDDGDLAPGDFTIETEGSNNEILTFELTLDNWPDETTWSITDSNGNIIDSEGPYNNPADDFLVISKEYSLEPGEYTITVNDLYGDGGPVFSYAVCAELEPDVVDVTGFQTTRTIIIN